MTERVARLVLPIAAGPEADAAELAVDLRERLLELDIERADYATVGQMPLGMRASEILLAGALSVTLAQSSKLFIVLIETVQS